MIGSVLQPELEMLVRDKKWEELKNRVSSMHPADVVEILVDVPDEDDAAIFRLLPQELAGTVFSYLPRDHQQGLLHTLSHKHGRRVLEAMTPDDQVRLLDALPAKVTRKIITSLSPDELKQARKLLS